MRIACGVEYDGAAFQGWQIQSTGVRTVQGAVEAALARVADEPIRTICAGRTDTGVHATGQVIHFETRAERPERAWIMGTNSHLPADVAVRWARPVPAAFHARFSTVDRLYRYLILEGASRPALWRARAAWSTHRLDTDDMQAAAAHLVGEHDFSAFRSAACQARNPIRTVHALEVRRAAGLIAIDVRANAFLHNMVRIIAGTLWAVGRGEQSASWAAALLAGRDRARGGATAPAHGLYFLGPSYLPEFALPSREDSLPMAVSMARPDQG